MMDALGLAALLWTNTPVSISSQGAGLGPCLQDLHIDAIALRPYVFSVRIALAHGQIVASLARAGLRSCADVPPENTIHKGSAQKTETEKNAS